MCDFSIMGLFGMVNNGCDVSADPLEFLQYQFKPTTCLKDGKQDGFLLGEFSFT